MAGNKIFLRFDQHAVPAALGAYSIQTLLHAPASFLNKHYGSETRRQKKARGHAGNFRCAAPNVKLKTLTEVRPLDRMKANRYTFRVALWGEAEPWTGQFGVYSVRARLGARKKRPCCPTHLKRHRSELSPQRRYGASFTALRPHETKRSPNHDLYHCFKDRTRGPSPAI